PATGDESPRRRGARLWAAWRDAVASLVRINPAAGPRWPVALQGGIAMATPIAVMTLAGAPTLGYQASVGTFTVLYLARLSTKERAKTLPLVGVALMLAAAAGVLASRSAVATLVGLVVVTAVAGAFAFGFALGPPGPLFFILIYGLSAQITGPLPPAESTRYLAAVLAGAAFAYLVALTPLVLRQTRAARARPLRELLPGPRFGAEARSLLIRAVIVGAAGTAIGVVVDPERAYWIVASGVGVVGVAVGRQSALNRGIHRVIGTVAGAGLYLLLVQAHPAGIWLALLLGLLQFLIELVVPRNYALALLLITPLVLLLTGAATGQVDPGVSTERIIDTLVGAVLGAASGILQPRARPSSGGTDARA
ncbi:MAG: FUSC family protein, partial [Microbacterium sp.]